MSPFIGSFTGSRAFGRGGGAGLNIWLANNSFSLISGTAGSLTAVYERTFTSVGTYTVSSPPFPISTQVLIVGGGGGAPGGIGGGGVGSGIKVRAAASYAADANLNTTATAGVVDDASTTVIKNVVGLTTLTGAGTVEVKTTGYLTVN